MLRRQHRGPSASADFDTNKENRMQEWLHPGGSGQQPLKAKRKLYCGGSLKSLSLSGFCLNENNRMQEGLFPGSQPPG